MSDRMHARICQALKRGDAMPRPRWAVRVPWRWEYLAVAATLAVAVTLGVIWVGDGSDNAGDALSRLGGLVQVTDDTAEDLELLVDETFADQKWAYLDRDARVAAEMLMDKLPLDMLALASKPSTGQLQLPGRSGGTDIP